MDEQADIILDRWVHGVNTRNLDALLSMYAVSAVLVPTFSGEIRSDLDGIRRYFMKLAESEKIEVLLDGNSKAVQQLTDSIYSLVGLYTWHIEYAGERKSFVARYTFTLDVSADRPILHHHSSLLPES